MGKREKTRRNDDSYRHEAPADLFTKKVQHQGIRDAPGSRRVCATGQHSASVHYNTDKHQSFRSTGRLAVCPGLVSCQNQRPLLAPAHLLPEFRRRWGTFCQRSLRTKDLPPHSLTDQPDIHLIVIGSMNSTSAVSTSGLIHSLELLFITIGQTMQAFSFPYHRPVAEQSISDFELHVE